MVSKTVRRRTFNSARATDEDRFLEDLRGLLWTSQGPKRTWKQLADQAQVNVRTMTKFATGDTKRPTFHTIFRLVGVLDARLNILRVR